MLLKWCLISILLYITSYLLVLYSATFFPWHLVISTLYSFVMSQRKKKNLQSMCSETILLTCLNWRKQSMQLHIWMHKYSCISIISLWKCFKKKKKDYIHWIQFLTHDSCPKTNLPLCIILANVCFWCIYKICACINPFLEIFQTKHYSTVFVYILNIWIFY